MNDEEVLAAALKKWGVPVQMNMMMEESAELIVVMNHYKRDRATREEVLSEMVDNEIVLKQMKLFFAAGDDAYDRIYKQKMDRVREKLGLEA